MNYRHFLELFNEIVERQPDSAAILVEGRKTYTYRELNQKAQSIAGQLVNAGVASGTVVGIGISKSAEYIASMLGIWYARAAFLPLDPELPAERSRFIVQQSGMSALLVRPAGMSVFEGLANSSSLKFITIDDDWGCEGTASVATSSSATSAVAISGASYAVPSDRLAYIIYTSGSTGRPKGVMVPHAGIVNFIEAQIDAFKLTSSSRALFFLSTNFDASVSDIGTTLLSGGVLCIEPQGLLRPGLDFMPLLKERKITHMDIPPSVLRTLDPADKPDSLETIIIGGEACAPEVVRNWSARCLVVNVYGPTEATVCTSLGACDPATWERPLIGQPIDGVDYFVLDEDGEFSKIGVPGELYIGGVSLALGYVDEPELTSRKFVSVRGQRLYRTGDQVILHDDREIEFLGRVDRQFKLRGMLIEPEEIESQIATHPDVARVAVLKRPAQVSEKRRNSADKLVAFVALTPGSALDSDGLKKHLLRRVTPWMVPSVFEFMNELPATITGKVDFSKLREAPLKAYRNRASSEVLTPVQSILVDVWKVIFGLEEVSLEDDFYELGGDSLNIVEAVVAAHIRGVTISPELIGRYPAIADLSREIEKNAVETGNDPAVRGMKSSNIREDIAPDIKELLAASKVPSTPATAPARSVSTLQDAAVPAPVKIFLTGATGFLGSRLLLELLDRGDAEVHCLVRSSSQAAGLERIQKALGLQGKKISKSDEKRILIVNGSLERPRFGLDTDGWNKLCTEIDTIIHCAAAVNMVKSYMELRPVNLAGTCHVAALGLEGRPKSLHYASTLSVFVATSNNTGVAMESDELSGDCTVYGGYAQTKVAAEMLLRSVENEAGMPISHYRFGLLTGDSQSGFSAKDDFLNMFIRGIVALGCAPESDVDVAVDITPIDYAAKAMAHIVAQNGTNRGSSTYHIANERSLALNDLLMCIRESAVDVETVSAQEFLSRLGGKAGALTPAESAACLALCRSLSANGSFERFRTMDLFQATDIRFDCRNTLTALAGTPIICPPPDAQLIQKYIAPIVSRFVTAREQ